MGDYPRDEKEIQEGMEGELGCISVALDKIEQHLSRIASALIRIAERHK